MVTRIHHSLFPVDQSAARAALGIGDALSILLTTVSYMMLTVSDLSGKIEGFPDGWADAFDTQDGVDLDSVENAVYDAANDLYSPTVLTGAMIPQEVGSIITDFNVRPTAQNDGVTSQNNSAAAANNVSGTSYSGKNYSSSPKRIGSAKVYGTNNLGFDLFENPTITLTLYGKNGSAPSTATDGTVLGTLSFTDTDNESAGRTVTNTNDPTTAWDYVWVNITKGNSNTLGLAEIEFYEPVLTLNMALQSVSRTADYSPGSGLLVVQAIPNEAISINTDLKGWVSRDDGETWTQVTLAPSIPSQAGVVTYSGSAEFSGAEGMDMRWKIATENGKDVDISGAAMRWAA